MLAYFRNSGDHLFRGSPIRWNILPKKSANASGQMQGDGIDMLNADVRIGVRELIIESRDAGGSERPKRRSRRVVYMGASCPKGYQYLNKRGSQDAIEQRAHDLIVIVR